MIPLGPIYATLRAEDESSYEIELAWTVDCSDHPYCHLGTITGSKSGLKGEDHQGAPVLLTPAIPARSTRSICGMTGCSESTICWRQGGFYYSLSLKGGKKDMLVKMARSALGPLKK